MTYLETMLTSALALTPREALGLAARLTRGQTAGGPGLRGLTRALDNLPGLERIARTFGLTPLDRHLLLAALLARIDDRVAPASLRHLETGLAARETVRRRLAPDAPLRRYALAHLTEGYAPRDRLLLCDERIEALVLGEDWTDPRLLSRVRELPLARPTAAQQTKIESAVQSLHPDMPARFVIEAPDDNRLAAARHLASRLARHPLALEPRTLPGPGERAAFWALGAREAALGGLVYVLDGAQDPDLTDEAAQALAAPLILHASGGLSRIEAACHIRLDPPDAAGRATVWADALPGHAGLARDLGAAFGLGPDSIPAVAARILATSEPPFAVARAAATEGLDRLIDRITPRFGLGALVLPEDTRALLEALVAQGRNRATVHGLWAFDSGAGRATGISALLAGRSGVGKTTAAEAIAHELDRDLFRVDLASTVSKYIGETEKALARIFDAAERAGAVLFFDEADTLFGKRTEIRDSKDRWANLGVSYLLQRIETYGGICVLATNLKGHIDIGFLRRLRYVIDISWPDAALREQIWRQVFPPGVPVAGMDFRRLAQLDLAGGHIGLVAINAAFLAAAQGGAVTMAEIETSARAEFRKLDKPFPSHWREATR